MFNGQCRLSCGSCVCALATAVQLHVKWICKQCISTTNGTKVDVFVEQWVSVVCGMTAHGMCGWIKIFELARHFRIEFESGRPIRIRIESRSFAGPYCYNLQYTVTHSGKRLYTYFFHHMVDFFAKQRVTWIYGSLIRSRIGGWSVRVSSNDLEWPWKTGREVSIFPADLRIPTDGSAGLRLWRSWCTEKHEAPLQILKLQKIDFHLKILW